jgi:serine protease Do
MISASRVRALSARRLILLATVAGIGLSGLAVASGGFAQSAVAASTATATAQPVGFADIVAKAKPAVISVRVKADVGPDAAGLEDDTSGPTDPGIERFFRQFGTPGAPEGRRQQNHRLVTGQGSGFFISADGYAVTNNHVVDKAKSVEITTDDGKTYSARVIGTDPRTDLALIKVDGRSDFPYAKLADTAPRIGDWVIAVGNPFGLGGTVTAGIVSARGRDIGAGPYDDYIQIDAPVNKGNSGGPSFDMDGNVIGVNTAIFSPSGGSVGIAFDIPADTVKSVVAQLKDKGAVTRGWIGVQIQSVNPEIADSLGRKGNEGALVVEPQPGSPGAQAGLQPTDVITAVDGKAVKDARDLSKQISTLAPGTKVELTVWRKGEEKSVSLTLGELPKERQARAGDAGGSDDSGATPAGVPKLGLNLAPASEVAGGAAEGVVVTAIDPNGLASEHGVKTGDVILDVGGKKVSSAADVRAAMGEAVKNGKHSVLLRLKSQEATRFVAIPLARA